MRDKTGIQYAVEHFEGRPSKLAAAMGNGVLRQHVEHWLTAGRVPSGKCALVEQATGGAVTRKDLRPDDWHIVWPELAAMPATAAA